MAAFTEETDMSEHDDTEAAPTQQASPPTTELPPARHASAESVQAWSLDDIDEIDSTPGRGWLISAGLVALVAVVGAALFFLSATFFKSEDAKPIQQSVKPSTTVPIAAPPSATAPPAMPPSAVRCGPAGCTPQPAAPSTAAAPNGVYRFDYPASGSGLDAVGPSSVWWKFSSECARDGCTALGQGVTGADHHTLVAGEFEIYTFSGDTWHLQASPPNPNDDAPNGADPGADCSGGGQTLAPQPDGSFLGISTAIVPPCGSTNTSVRTFQVVKVSS